MCVFSVGTYAATVVLYVVISSHSISCNAFIILHTLYVVISSLSMSCNVFITLHTLYDESFHEI